MMLWIICICAVLWVIAFVRMPLWGWTSSIAAVLIIVTRTGIFPLPILVLFWVAFLIIAIPFTVPSIRKKFFTEPILRIYKKSMPSVSSTEKEAIEAGTVWWDGDLFSGRPDWKKLLDFPKPELTSEEREFLDGPVEDLCTMLDDWHITEERQDLPGDVWNFIKEKGFFGMIIPKKYGGLEFSTFARSEIIVKIASRSVSAAVTVMVPNSLGPAELLLRYGTEEQKNYYLPRLARAEEIPCFGLTGPEAGSDAASIPDSGVVCRGEFNGKKDVIGIRLNWEKRYITLGPVATVLGLAFRLFDPEHILGDEEEIGITLALIPTNLPGITIGDRHRPLNAAFQVGPNKGEDVFILVDWIIGGPEKSGEGWRMLMDCLAEGRSVSLPALSAGTSKFICRETGAYARIRKQFNMPIGRFEGVEEVLARIGRYTYMIDAARIMTAGAVDLGEEPSVVSAIVKYHLTERSRTIVNDAMDVQGGAGICMGPRNFLASIYESTPISITVEGANILSRCMIIFGQGALRCHPFLLREMKAATSENEESGLDEFDRALIGHIGFVVSNGARALVLGISGSLPVRVPGDTSVRKWYRYLTRMSSALAFVSDITLLVLGGALKKKERISARLADVLSYLYLASSVLKKFETDGCPEEDLPLVKSVCMEALYIIQESFYGLFRNFPVSPVARLLKWIVFPLGRTFTQPTDKMDHEVADLLLAPSSARDRLTGGMFISSDLNEISGRLENALKKAIDAEEAEKKIQQAVKKGVVKGVRKERIIDECVESGVLNVQEAAIARDAYAVRSEVIKVDHFPQGAFDRKKA